MVAQQSWKREKSVHQTAGRSLLFLLVLLCGGIWTGTAWSQDYTELPVDESAGSQQTPLFQSLQSGAGNADQIKSFLNDFYLARWTVPDNYRQLHQFRRDLVTEAAGMSSAGRTAFLTAVIERLSEMAKDEKMAPAVRFNAVLTIASLDDSISDNTEVPYAPAIAALTVLMSNEANLPDYIVLGGEIGLVRHAALGVADDADKKLVIDALLALLEPAYGRSRNFTPDVVNYLQCRAVEGLAAFKSASGYGEGTRILDTFRRLLDEPKTDLDLVDAALRGIAQLNLSAAGEYDFNGLAQAMVAFYPKLIEKQIAFIDQDTLQKQVTGNSGGMGGSGMGMGGPGMGGSGPGGMSGPGMGGSGPGGMSGPGMGGPGGMRGPGGTSGDSSQVEPILGQIVYDLDSFTLAVKGTGENTGILSVLKEEDAESTAAVNQVMDEIKRSQNYFTYGADALEEDFDPKQVRLPNVRKGEKVYYVSLTEIKNFLEDELQTTKEWSQEEEE